MPALRIALEPPELGLQRLRAAEEHTAPAVKVVRDRGREPGPLSGGVKVVQEGSYLPRRMQDRGEGDPGTLIGRQPGASRTDPLGIGPVPPRRPVGPYPRRLPAGRTRSFRGGSPGVPARRAGVPRARGAASAELPPADNVGEGPVKVKEDETRPDTRVCGPRRRIDRASPRSRACSRSYAAEVRAHESRAQPILVMSRA